jgi:hypothetical protein
VVVALLVKLILMSALGGGQGFGVLPALGSDPLFVVRPRLS